MKLPGMPHTAHGIRVRAAAENWPAETTRGVKGSRGALLRFYPPSYVMALIEAGGGAVPPEVMGSLRRTDETPPAHRGRKKERPLSVVIGERLRAIRGTRDATTFAELCDITETDLRSWESGDALPPGWFVTQLHQSVGVNPMFLLAGVLPMTIGDGSRVEARDFPSRHDTVEILSILSDAGRPIFANDGRTNVITQKDRTEILLLAFGLLETAGLCKSADDVRALEPPELRKTVQFAAELHRIRKRGPTATEESAPVVRAGKRP